MLTFVLSRGWHCDEYRTDGLAVMGRLPIGSEEMNERLTS